MNRRDFMGLAAAAALRPSFQNPPDVTLTIGPVVVEIAPKRTIKTTGYNGTVPGPILRWGEGKPVTIDVINNTDIPELVHWHGLQIPSTVDGAAEENTPVVPGHGRQRYTFVPRPAGTRWYHTHGMAGRNLERATYTGQFGFFYIEPSNDAGSYDKEVFVALHGWAPYFTTGGDEDGTLDAAYRYFSVNSQSLGFGEPVRVKEGQRVLFRILNANATMTHRLALSGHAFKVVALDGNPLRAPVQRQVLEMGPAERIDAMVEMNQPGVWILGEPDDKTRKGGLGVVVEYANQAGPPRWVSPPMEQWSYISFSTDSDLAPSEPAERIPLVFQKKFVGRRWVDKWTINGKSFPDTDPIRLRTNARYTLVLDNRSDEAHPVHLHRHSFELTLVEGQTTSGVNKDVVVVGPKSQMEVAFIANNPGPTLFHCHQQLHMDYGFMTLLEYV